MTPDQCAIALKYMMAKLGPEEQVEIQTLLGGEEIPDLAEDALKGRIAFDRLPPRLARVAALRVAPKRSAEEEKAYLAAFPNAHRLGR